MKNLSFICQECNQFFKRSCDLSRHIGLKHYNQKIYYDKYIKKSKEEICLECSKKTKFSNWQRGYNKYCSERCEKIGRVKSIEKSTLKKYGVKNANKLEFVRNKIKQTNLKKYGNSCPMQNDKIQKNIRKKNLKNLGVELPFQSKEIQEKSALIREQKYGAKYTYQSKELKEKIIETNNTKYGVDHAVQSKEIQEKIKQTNLERYGFEYQIESKQTKNKIKQTNLERYGFENVTSNKKIREKIKKTMIKKYGFPYSMQNKEIFEKAQKAQLKIKQYKNTNIWYQGSYELDFLEKYYDKFLDLLRGPSIKYKFNKKNKVYFPDFYISSLNLIVECKNSYLAKRDKGILFKKKKSCENQGFNWIMIIDKNYSKFDKLLI